MKLFNPMQKVGSIYERSTMLRTLRLNSRLWYTALRSMQMKLAIVVKPWPFPIQEREKTWWNVNIVDISPIKKKAVTGLSKSVQMCTAKTIFLSQTSMVSLFFIQFYLWPCKLKLDEENWKHAGLAKERGFGPAVLHSLLSLTPAVDWLPR
jgi:hypothetical protein